MFSYMTPETLASICAAYEYAEQMTDAGTLNPALALDVYAAAHHMLVSLIGYVECRGMVHTALAEMP